jgi:PAS domain S-box-containing protein
MNATTGRSRLLPIAWLLVCAVVLQVCVAVASMTLRSSVRASAGKQDVHSSGHEGEMVQLDAYGTGLREVDHDLLLGDASGRVHAMLLVLNLGTATLLLTASVALVRKGLRMQAAVREGELRISGLFNAMTDGVVTVGDDDRIAYLNRVAERLFGVASANAIGRAIEYLIPQGLPLRTDSCADTAQGFLVVRVDGVELPLELSVSELRTEHGTMTTLVLRDLTELSAARSERRSLETLKAANDEKMEFLTRVSHELRTPLNAVLGFCQLLQHDVSGPLVPAQLARIGHIECAGKHLLALANDLLDFSRIESRQIVPELEAIDLRSVVDESFELVRAIADARGISLSAHPEAPRLSADARDAAVWVRADRLRLRQVLLNIVSNAVKYNADGGRVTVTWQLENEAWLIRIADSGQGMSTEQLQHMFQPFNRLGRESTAIEGTGIGLVIARGLVDMMHGDLKVDSAPGVGTVVTLTLPRMEGEGTERAALKVLSMQCATARPLRVLYAEDDPVNVELVRQMVSFRPNTVLQIAMNGATALAAAEGCSPDLVLVDMHLGDMTGIELGAALRRVPATADCRIVALSGDALPEQIAAALGSGIDGYMTKPVDLLKLIELLNDVADSIICEPNVLRLRPQKSMRQVPSALATRYG